MCDMHLSEGMHVIMRQMFYYPNKALDCCTVHNKYNVVIFGPILEGTVGEVTTNE